jgi:hypothetical protein
MSRLVSIANVALFCIIGVTAMASTVLGDSALLYRLLGVAAIAALLEFCILCVAVIEWLLRRHP